MIHHNTHNAISEPDDVIKNIFLDETEIYKLNYWLAPSQKTGDEASLVIDLGCIKEINGVYLKNFHNADKNNRGTMDFSIFVKENENRTWSQVTTEPSYLDRVYSYSTKKVQFVSFSHIHLVRYVKITIDSYYGNSGGGLSYFLESEGLAGSSYTSKI